MVYNSLLKELYYDFAYDAVQTFSSLVKCSVLIQNGVSIMSANSKRTLGYYCSGDFDLFKLLGNLFFFIFSNKLLASSILCKYPGKEFRFVCIITLLSLMSCYSDIPFFHLEFTYDHAFNHLIQLTQLCSFILYLVIVDLALPLSFELTFSLL